MGGEGWTGWRGGRGGGSRGVGGGWHGADWEGGGRVSVDGK